MKKIILLCLSIFGALAIHAETIAYDVNYKWGIIDVNIAKGTVSFSADGPNFYGTLDGTSISWEGHIICVSDTLQANMNGLQENVQYQAGWYRRPAVDYFQSRYYNPADPAIYRNIAGQGAYNASNDSMEAITVTSDMLGMYYFARVLNFESMKPGEQVRIDISGGYSREDIITYNGMGNYNGRPTYDCTFEYGYDGRMSGFPVECRIDTDSRLLLYIGASLPVGRVEMLYTSSW